MANEKKTTFLDVYRKVNKVCIVVYVIIVIIIIVLIFVNNNEFNKAMELDVSYVINGRPLNKCEESLNNYDATHNWYIDGGVKMTTDKSGMFIYFIYKYNNNLYI